MNAHGIKNVAALLGGWNSWIEAKLPVTGAKVKASSK
jgi:3-mercaptopyruvate sulfurtransferase SseA